MAMARFGRDHEGTRATIARKAWRLGAWSGVAILSLAAALVAAYTETGARRLASGDSAMTARGGSLSVAENETRRLADAVRVLSADRERLAARVGALERNLDDVTGAIPHRAGSETGDPAAASPLPPSLTPRPPAAAAPASVVAAPTTTTARAPQASADNRRPGLVAITADVTATGSTATRTEFGIDLGTAATVEGLRNLWTALKGTQAPLLEGLRPVVAVRDGAKPGTLELRLVAGPLANAGVAAKLCAALADAGLTCAPAVFDGQRLALN
jgi:hypothetical protein